MYYCSRRVFCKIIVCNKNWFIDNYSDKLNGILKIQNLDIIKEKKKLFLTYIYLTVSSKNIK